MQEGDRTEINWTWRWSPGLRKPGLAGSRAGGGVPTAHFPYLLLLSFNCHPVPTQVHLVFVRRGLSDQPTRARWPWAVCLSHSLSAWPPLTSRRGTSGRCVGGPDAWSRRPVRQPGRLQTQACPLRQAPGVCPKFHHLCSFAPFPGCHPHPGLLWGQDGRRPYSSEDTNSGE